jgi:hypothetical protein
MPDAPPADHALSSFIVVISSQLPALIEATEEASVDHAPKVALGNNPRRNKTPHERRTVLIRIIENPAYERKN